MNHQWRNSGAKVSIFLKNHEAIAAWLMYQDPNKLVIAMDVKKENLRTILTRDILRYDLDPKAENRIEPMIGSERLKRLEDLEPVLSQSFAPAVQNVDYRLLLRNAQRLQEITKGAQGSGIDRPGGPPLPPLIPNRQVYESLDLSLELVEEMQRTGLLPLIFKHADDLREIVHEETIPAFDAEWVGIEGAHHMVTVGQQSKDDLKKSTDMIKEAREQVWNRKDVARWVDGGGDIVLGATIATANVAAGVAVGIIGLLPTLGIGTVATVLGAATSAFTGLVTLKKGAATLIKGEG